MPGVLLKMPNTVGTASLRRTALNEKPCCFSPERTMVNESDDLYSPVFTVMTVVPKNGEERC